MSKRKDNLPKNFPAQPLGDILHSIDQFFQDTMKNFPFPRMIPIYQYETQKHYIIEAELPGVKKEQIHLDVYENYIRISVESNESVETKNDKSEAWQQTQSFERSERVVYLPFSVREEEVEASLSNGVLRIRIPNKRKTISIE
ncbi:Hsp20/alpha crystallin family protein [Texcoconibacillus texcoconensis]|uniref:HSP20 family molecular chaperone IbpA n=1 Tax=Texcoconibacillus texcoconensis TaxID=1095777 RepID=A0A840QLP0_9BACI|nr:Hsp20/alpha crystallin family protein [Texcoconibacillus texcoconensis]MBB5172260.1 HSP20 family molecular chaperone IbpA [Texcoconibacillus texcoconensis]